MVFDGESFFSPVRGICCSEAKISSSQLFVLASNLMSQDYTHKVTEPGAESKSGPSKEISLSVDLKAFGAIFEAIPASRSLFLGHFFRLCYINVLFYRLFQRSAVGVCRAVRRRFLQLGTSLSLPRCNIIDLAKKLVHTFERYTLRLWQNEDDRYLFIRQQICLRTL
jgi:hypothetical protein